MENVISCHILLGMWSLIPAGVKVNLCQQKGPQICLNPSGSEAKIVREKEIKIMSADPLTRCVNKQAISSRHTIDRNGYMGPYFP